MLSEEGEKVTKGSREVLLVLCSGSEAGACTYKQAQGDFHMQELKLSIVLVQIPCCPVLLSYALRQCFERPALGLLK